MTARAELSVKLAPHLAPHVGPNAAEVVFVCPHGLFRLPGDHTAGLAPVVGAVLSLHDELRPGPCTGRAWAALRAGVLPIAGATSNAN